MVETLDRNFRNYYRRYRFGDRMITYVLEGAYPSMLEGQTLIFHWHVLWICQSSDRYIWNLYIWKLVALMPLLLLYHITSYNSHIETSEHCFSCHKTSPQLCSHKDILRFQKEVIGIWVITPSEWHQKIHRLSICLVPWAGLSTGLEDVSDWLFSGSYIYLFMEGICF